MKGSFLTWEMFQKQDPKQTAITITYSSPSLEDFKVPQVRVLLGGFQSREEAWTYCKNNNIRGREVTYRNGEPLVAEVKLLRLSKLLREYEETHPKRTSAIQLAEGR